MNLDGQLDITDVIQVINVILNVGDLISFGLSHPCITFDKWRYFYLVNSKFYIVDVHKTFF